MDDPIDIKARFEKAVFRKFGWPGWIIFSVIIFGLFLLWNWEHARTVPFLGSIIKWASQERIPKADNTRFSIAAANLYGDTNEANKRVLLETLREVPGIQVLSIDRTISAQGLDAETAENLGHKQAQKYLSESGADVLVWGTILSDAKQTVFKLYLTSNNSKSWGRYQPSDNVALPQLFWNDTKNTILGLLAADLKHYKQGIPSAALPSQIKKMSVLLETKGQTWDPKFKMHLKESIAFATSVIGEQSGDRLVLNEAMEMYKSLLQEISRDKNPNLWAWTKHNLGATLMLLANYESGTGKLEEALQSFEHALEVRKRELFPVDWALTKANIGVTYRFIGEKEGNTKKILLGINQLRDALEELDPQRVLPEYLLTQHRLAVALVAIDGTESASGSLDEAEKLEQNVLKYWTAKSNPLFWVQAQLTLGRILRITGDRENAGPKLEKALQLIQAVENYYSSSSVSDPFIRAQMQYELGKTLQILGTGDTNTIGTSRLKEAIKRLYEALNVWTPKTNPVGWAQAHLAIGAALTALGTREEGTSRFQQAAKVYRAALSIVTRKNMPWVWAGLHYSLAITLFWSSEKERSPQQLCESFIHMREAWYTFSDSGSNLNSSEAQAQIVRITNTFERRYSKKQFSECLSGSIRRL